MANKKKKIKPTTILNLRGTFSIVAISLWIMFSLMFCLEKNGMVPEEEMQMAQTVKWIMLGGAIGSFVMGFITFFMGNDQFNDEKIRQCYEEESEKTSY